MAGQGLTKLFKPRVQSFGKIGSQITEGVGGAITQIGKSADEVGNTHRIMGGKFSVPNDILHNQVISRANSSKISSTSRSNQVFVGNRHPQLSPGVEDFTGLDVPDEALEWFERGGRSKFLNETFLNVGTKNKPNYITIQDLIDQYEAAPKSKKTPLKNKIDGYKSGVATPWAKDANDVIRYQEKLKPGAISESLKETNPELYVAQADKSLVFHHKSMKAIEYEIFKKMDELIASGDATVIDLINLHNLGKQFNIEAGSRMGGGVYMHAGPHNWMHKGRTIPFQIEPSSTAEAFGGFKTPLAKMKKPPKILEGISDADWSKVKASGAETLDDIEYIQNWAKKIGYTKALKKWKIRKAKGKIYVSDGKSEIQRMMAEIQAIKNPADLTQWRKEFLENVSKPMTEDSRLVESFAEEMSPVDLHKSVKWQKNQMREQFEGLHFNKMKRNLEDYDYKMDRASQGKGVAPKGERPPDPELEELLPHQLK